MLVRSSVMTNLHDYEMENWVEAGMNYRIWTEPCKLKATSYRRKQITIITYRIISLAVMTLFVVSL